MGSPFLIHEAPAVAGEKMQNKELAGVPRVLHLLPHCTLGLEMPSPGEGFLEEVQAWPDFITDLI